MEAVLALGSFGIKTLAGIGSAAAEKRALKIEENEAELAATQKRIKQDDNIQRVLSSQLATESGSIFSASSASFGAISKESIDQFAEDREVTNLNLELQKANISQQKSNINMGVILGTASNLVDAGLIYHSIKNPVETGATNMNAHSNSFDPLRFENAGL